MTRREEAVHLIEGDIRRVYTQYYPIHRIVEETGALKFVALVQTGIIVYESRDYTHFILPTNTLCDLLRPPQYQYAVARYNQNEINLGRDYYGTEIECRAWVTRQQARLYGFDPKQYHLLKTQLLAYEETLYKLYKDATDDDLEVIEIKNHLQLTMREVRMSLGLAEDRDLPDVTVDHAAQQAEGTRG